MIWCILSLLAAKVLPTAATPSPVDQDSDNLFDVAPEIQAGSLVAPFYDESSTREADNLLEAENIGDDSILFGLAPNSDVADNLSEQFLPSDNSEYVALASEDSSCGVQSSSGAPHTEADLSLGLFNLNGLDTRGFFDDVDQLQNEVIDPPHDSSCPAGISASRKRRPNNFKDRHNEEGTIFQNSKLDVVYPVQQFGKCPVLKPDYKEALCCTGVDYGTYISQCAPGTISFSIYSIFLPIDQYLCSARFLLLRLRR